MGTPPMEEKRSKSDCTSVKTVLVMEDEMDMRFYLMTLIKSLGYRPVLAQNGAKGLEMLEESRPDLVILDVMMPEKGGALVYVRMKTDLKFKDIPLIVFSGVHKAAFHHYIRMLNTDPKHDIPFPRYYVEKSAEPNYLKGLIKDSIL